MEFRVINWPYQAAQYHILYLEASGFSSDPALG
jgi:hypothetical protein